MMNTTSLLIISDNRMFHDCLALALGGHEGLRILDATVDSSDPLDSAVACRPDIVLLDFNFSRASAIELTAKLRAEHQLKVVILGINEDDSTIIKFIEAGACGYVFKEESLQSLVDLINSVRAGGTLCSPYIAYRAFSRVTELARRGRRRSADGPEGLTFREMEVLELISLGMSNKEIAGKLFLSLHTVKNHVHNILDKLQVQDRTAAANYDLKAAWAGEPPNRGGCGRPRAFP